MALFNAGCLQRHFVWTQVAFSKSLKSHIYLPGRIQEKFVLELVLSAAEMIAEGFTPLTVKVVAVHS